MSAAPFFIGIDLGTGSCKSVVVGETGRVLGFGVGEYGSAGAGGRWQEQAPSGLLSGTVGSVRAALGQAGVAPVHCAGLSVGGALHSVMAVDGRDNPLTGVIT
ncbi:MAG: FGGY family carbohydrate kinase, partial [Hyphomicrobiales bacterium]